MRVKDVMSKNVITIKEDTKIKEACEILADNRIGCLVVKKKGKVCGIVTERDIIGSIAKNGHVNIVDKKVSDIMTKYVISVNPNSGIKKAIDLLVENKIKKLPVISKGKIVGIITVTDVAAIEPKIVKIFKNSLSKKIKKYLKFD